MRLFLLPICLFFTFSPFASINSQSLITSDLPSLCVGQDSVHLGTVEEGDTVRHTFVFKNVGKSDLVIQTVKPSCGCTTPIWSKEPIKPGETGEIKAEFPSRGYMGLNNKTLTVISNGDPKMLTLKFDVMVIEKEFKGPPPSDDAQPIEVKPNNSSLWGGDSSPW